jgi:hypothetical protein
MSLVPLYAAANRFGTGAVGALLVGGPLFLIPYAHQVAKVNQMAQDALKISTELVNTKTALNREIQEHTLTRHMYFDTHDELVETKKQQKTFLVSFGAGLVAVGTVGIVKVLRS